TPRATHHFIRARDEAEDVLGSPEPSPEVKKVARQVHDSAVKALAPLDKSQTFANLSFFTAYDSNAIFSPAEAGATRGSTLTHLDRSHTVPNLSFFAAYASIAIFAPAEAGSTRGSPLTPLASASAGYVSSPFGFIQFVPNLSASLNYNWNPETYSAEYASLQ